MPVAVRRPAARGLEALSPPRRSDAQKWYEEGSPAATRTAGERRPAGIRQQLGRQGPVGPGRDGLEEGDYQPRAGAGSGSFPWSCRPARSRPGPAIPTRSSTWPRCGRGWCWCRSWKVRRAGQGGACRVRPAARRRPRAVGRPRGQLCRSLGGTVGPERLVAEGQPGPDWPTFAGSPTRNTIAPEAFDVAGPWRVTLGQPIPPPAPLEPQIRPWPTIRLAPLAFHPVISRAACLSPIRPRSSGSAPIPAGRPGATAERRSTANPEDAPRRCRFRATRWACRDSP